jgi:glucose dehydrogenase
MTQQKYRSWMLGAGFAALFAGGALAQTGENVEWPTYGADLAGSHYRPLDQINASNFSKLEVVWRFKTDNIGNRPEYKLEGTPLEVGGVVYTTAGSRRGVIALDAVTGELLWVHGEHEGARGGAAPRQLSGRGLSYWSDGKEARILYVTPGYRLVALDAKTGQPVQGFGDHGIIDLKQDFDQEIRPDLTTGEVGLHAAPTVAGNIVLVGAAFREGFTPATYRNNKGYVRAYDARTGKRLWTFHTIPKKGEFGYDTWFDGSADNTGNTGVWNQITVDRDLNTAYLPVESPTGDFYGGYRPGPDLFGESVVAVDLNTGKLKWFFQMVHHPLWDMDASAAPMLMDITVGGKAIKAVAQPSKQGWLYVLDRTNGKPVWPMPEKKVEKGNVPGEWYAPTQPFPTKPKAYSRNGVSADDFIDFTPALRAQALEKVKNFKMGPVFTPPVLSTLPGPLGTLTLGGGNGGTNWPGGSFNPETHTAFLFACNSCFEPIGMVPPPQGLSDMRYIEGLADTKVEMVGTGGAGSGADTPLVKAPPRPAGDGSGSNRWTVDGMPIIKPPYATITAINLDTGDFKWQIPHGETPDIVRNNPALKGMTIPRTGQTTYNIGTLVTKNLVIAGEGQLTNGPDHPRGAMLRAYDQMSGKEVGAVFMPAPQSGTPMTYMVNGKQYIIVAISGGNYSGEYLCFALPDNN